MLKLFKNSFKTTNDCIILATPLIIFLSVLGWYYNYAADSIDNVPKFILAGVTMLVMASGFLAAWLYMAKKTIALSKKIFVFDKDRVKALATLALSLPNGIGRLFLPIIGVVSIYILIYLLLFSGINYLISHFVGVIDFDAADWQTLMLSSENLTEEISKLSEHELLALDCWSLSSFLGILFVSFTTMLWIPEIVYNEKNSFKALYNSVVKLFMNFKKSIILFLYIAFLVILITILNTFLMFNPFLYFFVLMFYYYLLVYIVVLLFTYYDETYIKT